MNDARLIDQLRDLVVQGDREKLCTLLDPLDEKQRSELKEEALEIGVAIDRYWGPGGLEIDISNDALVESQRDLLKALDKQNYVDWRVPRWTVNLLVVAVCDLKTLDKPWDQGLSWLRDDLSGMPERLLRILVARKPKWLAKWVEKEWRNERPVPNSFVERGLIREGLIPASRDSGYYDRLANDSMESYPADAWKTDVFKRKRRSVKEVIDADPELLKEEIWGIFEFDSSVMRNAYESWSEALVSLSDEGKIDRRELLKRSLQGMGLPLSPGTLTGMGKFHQLLGPTVEERESFLQEYLSLFSASQSTVVGQALAACEVLLKAKRLDANAFFAALPDVFRIEKKAQPMKALGITKKLLKQESSIQAAAAIAIVEGVQHDNADVQSACLKLLDAIEGPIPVEAQSRLASLREHVAASLKNDLESLLRQDTQVNIEPVEPAGDPPSSGRKPNSGESQTKSKSDSSGVALADLKALKERAEKLPKLIQKTSGLLAAFEQHESGKCLTWPPVTPHEVPRRDRDRQVNPVENVAELIELVSSTIESIEDVMDLERILDGISRFHRERPADFDSRTSSLKKRIVKQSERHSGRFLDQANSIGLTRLLNTWLEMPETPADQNVHWYSMRGWFLRERISGLTNDIVQSRQAYRRADSVPMPLLSLPTHLGGWIDPMVLVQRINDHYAKHRELLDSYDFAQALLRLMPEGRSQALGQLDKPSHYNGGHLLRYALGDDCELKSFGGWGEDAVKAAAVRARHVILPNVAPVLPIAKAFYRNDQSIAIEGAITDDPTVPFSLAEVALSVEPFFHRVKAPTDKQSWLDTWESLTNPFDTSASCMAGHLGHLLDPESTWNDATCRLFVMAAGDERGENRILATDGLLDAIARSLVSPEILGTVIANTLPFIKLNRLSKVLSSVAGESKLHRFVISQSIEFTILHLEELPIDIQLLLSVLLESSSDLGIAPGQTLAEKLSAISGSSKTAKLAKQLVKLTEATSRQDLDSLVLATFVQRGERWHATASFMDGHGDSSKPK
ncbi:DUF6493 family protein [Stieleria varia]|uniref:Uncharacterized protein n=1 Tax=Stieleria varia TaxID=2528005 RepID=A0A5C6AZ30_9BACT|nr:DUF6493 family protein [Stieleria varia]TWU04409.1 hypothetical protein Pla52n_24490 [Stieleria varia]